MALVTHMRGPAIPGSAQRIFIAAPTTEAYRPPFVASLFEAATALHGAGIQADFCMEVGNCHVDDARNSLVRRFLMTDCTDLVFIDADVGFLGSDLVKLVQYDRDVVAGVYPKKTDDEEFPIAVEPGAPLWAEPDGCVVKGIIGLPTGFMRIKRHVLETMVETFKSRSFRAQGHKDGEPLYTVIFEREIAGGKRYSGDYNFCRRWLALGGSLAVDPYMRFAHEGAKQWVGDLASFWRREHGVVQQAFDAAIAAVRVGQAEDRHFLALCDGWDNARYSGDPLLVAAAYHMARKADGPILELGSGLTTLVLALARPDLPVHVLEHDPIWATKTRDAVEAAGATNVTMHYAPLADYAGGRWYRPTDLARQAWSLVVMDGPPRTKGNRSVFFDMLGDQIGDAAILMDDAEDPAQLAPFKRWAEAHGRTVQVTDDEDRGAAVSLPVAMKEAA